MARILARMAHLPESEVRSIQADSIQEVKHLGRAPTFLQSYRREQGGSFCQDDVADEDDLLCIYNPGTRQGAIEALTEMRGHLQADEDELL